MKVYTQEEFNAFPIDEYGIKHCPSATIWLRWSLQR